MADELILLVEDDELYRKIIRRYLLDLRYLQPLEAVNGNEALHLARKERPALALVDIDLPGEMDGIEVASLIRSSLGIPAVFVTALTDPSLIDRACSAEPVGYLVKPINKLSLHGTIQTGLARHKLERRFEEREVLRAKNEEALISEQRKLSSLLKAFPYGIYIVNQAHDIEYVSPVIENEYGAVNGRKCYAYFHDRDEICPWCKNDEVLAGKSVRWEWWSFKNDKTYELFDTPIFNNDGTISKLEIFIDITERKRAEEALRESRTKLETALASTTDAVFISDIEGRFIDFNDAFATFHKFKNKDECAKTLAEYREFLDVFMDNGELAPLDQWAVPRALRGETATNAEYTLRRKDTGETWVGSYSFAPIRDHDGKIVGSVVVGRDITEHKLAEEALKESKERLEFVLKGSQLGFWDWNLETNEVKRNERWAEMLGYKLQEIDFTVKQWIDFIHPDDRSMAHQSIQDHLANRTPLHKAEYRMLTKDGQYRWILDQAQIVKRDYHGRPIRMSGTHTDITERKQAEDEKAKLQVQFIQSQKMESIGTLAGGVAHDFNNLLQAITGYAQIMLLDKKEDDPDFLNLKAILNAGGRAAQLVQQLLLFSRKVETQKKPVDLNHELEQARKILERTIPKMIGIQLNLGDQPWTINADPVQIEQVLLNLGTNAADAMPDGGLLVIETENIKLGEDYSHNHLGAAPGNYVLLTVSDTGSGMDQETQEKIFEPFFTTKELGKGTGLGLASVYGIVKAHGGYIMCYSEVGQGTTFKIYLPAIEQQESTADNSAVGQLPPGGTETILLADDEASIRGFASTALQRFGYTVITATSGEEALEASIAQKEKIDLVILDIGMPGMGGHKCLQELLKIDRSVKVVIASGYSADAHVKKSLDAGAIGYVGKPYQLNDLLNKVRAVLDGKD
ncbi:MAG: response regulator [Deltaproteobacteria bacterium]|nr:response regulator [Deltaproteobacteria bacterium]